MCFCFLHIGLSHEVSSSNKGIFESHILLACWYFSFCCCVALYCDAQHTFLCCVYFALLGKITAGAILPLAKHNWLKQSPEVYRVWNFWLRLHSCFGWIYSDSAPKQFQVLDSDSCLNSKVNAINFWQCLNDRIQFSL